jgi:hypothetical protein
LLVLLGLLIELALLLDLIDLVILQSTCPGILLSLADFNNCLIRKITSFGNVTTFAGLAGSAGSKDGVGSFARFNGPLGIAIHVSG